MSKKEFWKRQPRLKCPDCSKKYKHRLSFVYHQALKHNCSRDEADRRLSKVIEEYNTEVREINKRLEERRRQEK